MGGKSKQSQRTKNNVRPSSSGRSAELLSNAVHIDPSLLASSKPPPVLFPTLAAPLDAGLNPDFTLCLKKLNKKDPITKTKALQELTELVKKGNVEDVTAALPSWAHYYRTLTTDTDHKVREATQVAHGAVVAACGRRAAPQLRQLVPPWLTAQYDEYAPAAAAARHSLTTTFPEGKLPDVISFCMNEVIAHLLENLVGNVEATLSKKMLSPEEKELVHGRLVTASLQGLQYFTQHLPAQHDAWLWAQLAPALRAPAFWKLAEHPSPQIKASWFGALGRLIARFKDTFGAAYGQRTGRLMASGAGGAQLWGCLLLLMHHVQDWHTWLDKKELLVKKIIDLLENGGWGDAKHLSSMLLPLLAYLPGHLLTKEFYESFFRALFKGLEKKGVISSKSERQSWITSLSECLRYLSVQEKDYAVEVTTSVHRTWLEIILLNPYDSQTTNNLIKHSATCMVALVKYWLKQSKEANGDKYDQLVRNFWQNVAATMLAQTDKLSTEESDITSLIESHTLFLQSMKTSFSIDAKKPKNIKFDDEEQGKPVESEEPTQQCDASIVVRYNHNLNEIVQKITAHYFEFASKKQVANYVFAPLLTLVIEFDDKDLFLELARHFNTDSVYALYDKVLRDWLAGDTMRCKAVADVVFLSMKHMAENEQEATLNSFQQFPPSVVEWCISLSLSHPHCSAPAVRRWLRGDLVETSLVAVCKRMINDDDGKSKSLLLMCLAHDENGETLISPSSVSRIVELVGAALAAAAAPERLARAACALCSELGACPGLARALLRQQLRVPRGDGRLGADTWREVRSAWQEAGATASSFRADAVRDIHEALDNNSENLDIQNIEHIASLSPYLVPRFDDEQTPDDIHDTADLTRQLFNFAQTHEDIQTHALRHDCIHANLNCPFDDDNDYIKRVIEESSTAKIKELTRTEAVSYLNKVVFRGSFLKVLATHTDEDDNAWCEQLFREKYFEEEFARVLHDYALLCSLYEGYAFWPHYSIISLAKSQLSSILDDVIAVMSTHIKTNILAYISELAVTKGYYWSYAKAMFEGKMPKSEGDAVQTSEMENLNLEEITGNGFFHTLQADTRSSDAAATVRAKYLVMLRSFYLAHAHDATVVDAAFVRAAAASAHGDPDVIIDAYYRHQHTMLYETDIAAAEWRQVVSNAAVVDYLTAMVGAHGWDASAARWDFATITLCSITSSVLKSVDNWGSPKVALLARSVFALYRAVHEFVSSVQEECLRRQPSEHVAQLPSEWRDIFAPDLTNSLLKIVLKVLETSSSQITAPQAAFIASLHPLMSSLHWPRPARAQQASHSLSHLLDSALAALGGRSRRHHAVQYLAHALLSAVAKPLVLHDAEALAAWMDDSSNDDDDAPRVRLLLAGAGPALSAQQELADSALQPLQVGEDTCEIEPYTDSHSVILGYLLMADAVFAICQLARGDLTHHYLELFRELKHAEVLITVCLRLLPRAVWAFVRDSGAAPPRPEPAFTAPTQLRVDEPATSAMIGVLACRCLFHCARWAGGAMRGWWGAAPPRAARALGRLCRGYVAPALVREQLAAAAAGAAALTDAEVTVHYSTNEVICVYHVEERAVELEVALGAEHPLAVPRVSARQAPAHNTHWLAVYLGYQNGSVINALRMWIDAVTKRVEASPQCYICYCRLHPASGRLPRVPCHQCRNKYHAHCLRKWFSSSNKSNCPLCRASF